VSTTTTTFHVARSIATSAHCEFDGRNKNVTVRKLTIEGLGVTSSKSFEAVVATVEAAIA
jgi:hypothetical protein